MHVLLPWINQDCVRKECSFIYLEVSYCAGTQSTHMSVFNKKLNPYQTKNTYPWSIGPEQLQFRKLFWSSSMPTSLHHLPQPEHQVQAALIPISQQQARKQEDTFTELGLGQHNLHPWAVQLDDSSKDSLKLATKHSGNTTTSSATRTI